MTTGGAIKTRFVTLRISVRKLWPMVMPALVVLPSVWGLSSCTKPSNDVTASDPDIVALAYVHAMLSNNYVAAQQYIAEEDVQSFRLLTTGVPPGRLEGIGLHSETKVSSSTSFTVVMLGKLCKSAQGAPVQDKSPSNTGRRCLENQDPEPTKANLAFQVRMAQEGDTWTVRIPLSELVKP